MNTNKQFGAVLFQDIPRKIPFFPRWASFPLSTSEVGKAILLAVDEFLSVWSSLSRCVVDLSGPPSLPDDATWFQLCDVSEVPYRLAVQISWSLKNQLKEPQNLLCHSIQRIKEKNILKWKKAFCFVMKFYNHNSEINLKKKLSSPSILVFFASFCYHFVMDKAQ